MTIDVTLRLGVDEDTFDGRWARWVADGRERDQTLHRRAVGAAVLVASALAIAAVWVFTLA